MAGKNDIERYSMYNEGKSVITERFIKTFNNKIYEYMTSIPKNVYIDKLGDIVNRYNNTYHRTIKMKLVYVKPSISIDSRKEINDKDHKFKIGDIFRTWKYKNYFAKENVPKTFLGLFMKKNCKKQIKKSLELKK